MTGRARTPWLLAAGLLAASPLPADDAWPHWGGPSGNFTTRASPLAEVWPAEGPPRLWTRPIGEGHSTILVRDETLFTHYREGDDEIVIALSATDGSTLWQHSYAATTAEHWRVDFGAGPHATPALSGDRLFAVGMTGRLHALSATDGSVVWSKDLVRAMGGTLRELGYSASPVIYEDTVVLPVGGEGQALVAFDQADGSLRWKSGDEDNSFSTPALIELEGRPQLIFWGAENILGVDPGTGEQLWQHPHPTHNAFNISTPLYWDDGLLFVSSAYDGGTRALQLSAEGDSTTVEELWFSNQMRVHFGTAIRLGDVVYASSGDFGPSPMTAIDVRSGEILWRDRAFAKSSILLADGKFVVLDEDGELGLARVSPEGMDVIARAPILESQSWTVPTLVGSRLFVRNREEIAAFDLSPQD